MIVIEARGLSPSSSSSSPCPPPILRAARAVARHTVFQTRIPRARIRVCVRRVMLHVLALRLDRDRVHGSVLQVAVLIHRVSLLSISSPYCAPFAVRESRDYQLKSCVRLLACMSLAVWMLAKRIKVVVIARLCQIGAVQRSTTFTRSYRSHDTRVYPSLARNPD